MYALGKKPQSEEIECPFTGLGLLTPDEGPSDYRFRLGEKSNLPDMILLAACFDYARASQSKLVSLNKLTYGFNSPGIVFKLSETELGNRIERSIENFDGVDFTESYGNRQLQFQSKPEQLHREVLETYYNG